MKEKDSARLTAEYQRLVQGLQVRDRARETARLRLLIGRLDCMWTISLIHRWLCPLFTL